MNIQDAEFSSLVLHSDAWLQQSEQFLLAAKQLMPALTRKRPITRETSNEINSLSVGALKATLLLLGVSIENALKAAKVKQGSVVISNGKIDKASFGSKKGGHDLLWLAESAELKLEPREVELLEQLTEVVLWAGKYQQPLSAQDFGRAKKKNPRTLTVPRDIDLVEGVIGKARAIVRKRA